MKTLLGSRGLVWLAGALFAVALGIYLSAVRPLQAEIDALASAPPPTRASAEAAPSSATLRDAELATFRTYFTSESARTTALAKLAGLARKSGVTLLGGEFTLVRETEDELARYRMTLPVAGTYPQIRRFVALVLDGLPTLSLDDLRLARDSVEVARIEAQLRFTHFAQPERP